LELFKLDLEDFQLPNWHVAPDKVFDALVVHSRQDRDAVCDADVIL
jgi:hypothetical protein